MADITMCDGKNCLRKDECYRYMAKADKQYQSYAMFELNCMANCYDFFLEIPAYDNQIDV